MKEYIDRSLIEWYGCDFEDDSCKNRECSGCSYAEWLKDYKRLLGQQPCEDCVSRKRLMDNYNGVETPVGYRKVVDLEVIKNMPSVTPTRKKGHWIITGDYLTAAYETIDYVKCSCCGEDSLEEGDYCPNCGSFMRGEFE